MCITANKCSLRRLHGRCIGAHDKTFMPKHEQQSFAKDKAALAAIIVIGLGIAKEPLDLELSKRR